MKITFSVDVQSAFRNGVSADTPTTIEVDPASLSQEDRDLIAARMNGSGYIASRDAEGWFTRITSCVTMPSLNERSLCHKIPETIETRRQCGSTWYLRRTAPALVVADLPTVESLVEAIRWEDRAAAREAAEKAAKAAEAAAKAAEAAAKEAAEGDRWLTGPPQQQTLSVGVSVTDDYDTVEASPHNADATATYLREYVYTNYGTLEQQAACKVRDAALVAETEQRRQAALVEVAARLYAEQVVPVLEWVRSHGSHDLQRTIAEGIAGWGEIYREERDRWDRGIREGQLLAERPGWIVVDSSELSQPVRPGTRAWTVLDTARKIEPTARLMVYGNQYVAAAEFDGQTIVWPGE